MDRDEEDLTARARIRDAALLHIGEHGFERATIRGIAETAGVSSGLVRHHFGSKQALRDACDEYLHKVISRLNDRARADTTFSDVNYVADARATMGPYQRYLSRALVDGTAAPLFDEMVRMTEEWIAAADAVHPDPPGVDAHTRAAVLAAMALGIPILYQHVSRGLGVDLFSPEGGELLTRTMLDIYSRPMLSAADAAKARAGLDRARTDRGDLDD
ncbi:MAG TPA: helix-turn-helix domain-containing protein [Pseudonocardiaceae bacterium]|nr:helix-turn-helix domain-containing protein [Pseudonocardiaceae bacterium]